MPTPGNARRAVRMDDRLWRRFGEVTGEAGLDRSEVIRDFIAWYTREPGAKRPTRPDAA